MCFVCIYWELTGIPQCLKYLGFALYVRTQYRSLIFIRDKYDDLCSRPENLCWYSFIYTYAFFIRVLVIKQSASSGICLTPQGQGFCQGLSGQPHCVTRSYVYGISQCKNNKMKLISNFSTYSDQRRKGTIGENVECISRFWNCSYDYLCENTASTVDIETSDRVRAIKELTACKDMVITCQYFIRPNCLIWLGKLHVIKYCWTVISNMHTDWTTTEYLLPSLSYMIHAYCNFFAYSPFVFVPFHYCTTSTK